MTRKYKKRSQEKGVFNKRLEENLQCWRSHPWSGWPPSKEATERRKKRAAQIWRPAAAAIQEPVRISPKIEINKTLRSITSRWPRRRTSGSPWPSWGAGSRRARSPSRPRRRRPWHRNNYRPIDGEKGRRRRRSGERLGGYSLGHETPWSCLRLLPRRQEGGATAAPFILEGSRNKIASTVPVRNPEKGVPPSRTARALRAASILGGLYSVILMQETYISLEIYFQAF